MTVKELIETLEACNPDATIMVGVDEDDARPLHEENVYHLVDSGVVLLEMLLPSSDEEEHNG